MCPATRAWWRREVLCGRNRSSPCFPALGAVVFVALMATMFWPRRSMPFIADGDTPSPATVIPFRPEDRPDL